jgi:hypothetical protein
LLFIYHIFFLFIINNDCPFSERFLLSGSFHFYLLRGIDRRWLKE